MPAIGITLNLDANPWVDLREHGDLVHINTDVRIGVLPGGMQSGKASVAICAFMQDGRPVIIETSLELLQGAMRAINARYGANAPRGEDA